LYLKRPGVRKIYSRQGRKAGRGMKRGADFPVVKKSRDGVAIITSL
jgi:hypothetical protein